jgi:tetratricopeptide (TPR) repeat protein
MIRRLLIACILIQSVAQAQTKDLSAKLDDFEKRIYSLEQSMNFVLREYVSPEELSLDIEKFSKRLARAETLFYLQDYQSASVLVYDIVEEAANEKEPQYWDAVNLLAESLYRIKNYYGARNYFNKLLNKGDKKYFYTALERVIQISAVTGNYEGLDRYFNIVKQLPNSTITSGIYFTLGKTLYKRGDLTRASEIFGLIDKNSEYYINSRFYLGVIEIKKKNLDNALAIFKNIISLEPQTPEHRDLREQAILAVGRIYYEQGKYPEALDAYQGIPRDSPHFEEALYEISWIYVKSNELSKAKQTLELMLLSTNETPELLNAKALYGSVLMKMGEYNPALENFQEMVDRYYPVKEQLQAILEEKENPVQYFEELLLKEPDGMALKKVLPPVVFNWASTDSKVKKALSISTDISGNIKSIEEVEVMADALSNKLNSPDKVVIFPQLKEAKLKAAEIRMGLDEVRRNLMDMRAEVLGRYISKEERDRLEDIKRKKAELTRIIEELPKDAKGIEEKEREIIKRVSALEAVIHQLNIALEGMKAQLFAVEKWLNENKGKLGDPEQEEDFARKVKMEWSNVNEIEQDINKYTAEIKRERGRIGALTMASEGENKRLELKKLEDEERRMMDSYKNRLSNEDAKILNRIDNLTIRLSQDDEQFARFDARIDSAVEKKAKALKDIIEKEKKNLAEYKKIASSMTEDSKELIGKIGYSGFRQVKKLFSDLVLKADVGLVDVAWKQKEEVDRKIEKLREDQDKELKGVNEEFNIDLE